MSKCLHVGELEEKDRKRYKADFESKKDSTKAQYWLDPERKKEREGLLRYTLPR